MPNQKGEEEREQLQEFFEYLSKKGLSSRDLDEVHKWGFSETLDFIVESRELLPSSKKDAESVFEFVANSSLSGGRHPCAALECRLARADQMARFAALYADRVLIRDPFAPYAGLDHNAHDYSCETLKKDLADDLQVLYHLRPLLQEGLVGFAASEFHFCKDCYQRYVEDKRFGEVQSRASTFLKQKLLREASFSLVSLESIPVVEVTGPEELVEHGKSYFIPNRKELQQALRQHLGSTPYCFTKGQVIEYGFLERYIAPVISDIVIQNWYSGLYNTHYVTDHELDFDIIATINDSATNEVSKALIEGFSHSIPFIHDVELNTLLKLRRREGESFRVYRDALTLALQSATYSNPEEARQAFADLVRPELNRIELTIRNSRKLLWGSLTRDLLFSAGFVAIGLFSGLLPPNVGEIVAALGGFKFVSGSMEKVSELLQDPSEVKDSKYYFLWKVKRKA